MSVKYFCDRCGTETDDAHPRFCPKWDSEATTWYTLCKACSKSLKRWFKGEDA